MLFCLRTSNFIKLKSSTYSYYELLFSLIKLTCLLNIVTALYVSFKQDGTKISKVSLKCQ